MYNLFSAEKVTEKAKGILKRLENKDITLGKNTSNYQVETPEQSETERIIKDIDVNNMTPIQAFNLLME